MRPAPLKTLGAIAALLSAGVTAGAFMSALLGVAAPPGRGKTAPPRVPSIIMLAMPGRPAQQARRIVAWIAGLSSRRYSVRKRSQRRLEADGAAAAVVRRALHGITNPETRKELRRVLRGEARSAALASPLVTLKLTNAPLGTVLARLGRQAGADANFADQSPGAMNRQRRLAINVQDQPFWKVMRRIARVTGYSADGMDEFQPSPTMTFASNGLFGNLTPVDVHGPFMMAVEWSMGGQTINYDAGPESRARGHLALQLEAYWASRRAQLAQVGPLHVLKITDDRGDALPSPGDPPVALWSAPQINFSYHVRFKEPSRRAKSITSLRGYIPMTLCVAPRIYRVSKLDSGAAYLEIDGVRLTFGKPTLVTKNATHRKLDRYTVPVTIIGPANAQQLPLVWAFLNTLPQSQMITYERGIGANLGFTSAGGRRLLCRAGGGGVATSWHENVRVAGGMPVGAWVKFFTGSFRTRVPFHFRDVPIPR